MISCVFHFTRQKIAPATLIAASFYFCLFSLPALAESQGPKTAGSASGTNWTNPEYTAVSDDNKSIYDNTSQDDLVLTNFGFDIPTGATIDGIVVTVEGLASSGTLAERQYRINLTKDGSSAAGTWKGGNQLIAVSDTVIDGGTVSTDLFDTTWTVSEVNSANFGVLISDNNTTAAAIKIDYVGVIIHYTPGGGGLSLCDVRNKGSGEKTAGTASGTNWTNPENTTSSDDSAALYSTTTQDELYLTNFDFRIPDGADIKGVLIKREGKQNSGAALQRMFRVGLTKDASTLAGNRRSGSVLVLADETRVLGGANDLWGTTLTPAEVRSSNFGIMISDNDTTANGAFNLDYITVTVCYTRQRAMRIE